MKSSIFVILTIISVGLLSCKKEAALKPTPVLVAPAPAIAVKPVAAVKTPLYDYQKAILVKRTIAIN